MCKVHAKQFLLSFDHCTHTHWRLFGHTIQDLPCFHINVLSDITMKGHTLINGFDHLYHSVIITLKNYPLQTHFICDANSNACLAAKNSTSSTVDGNGMLALSAAIGCPLESLSTTPIPALPDSLKTAPLKFALIFSLWVHFEVVSYGNTIATCEFTRWSIPNHHSF